jgi:hypothetical protein
MNPNITIFPKSSVSSYVSSYVFRLVAYHVLRTSGSSWTRCLHLNCRCSSRVVDVEQEYMQCAFPSSHWDRILSHLAPHRTRLAPSFCVHEGWLYLGSLSREAVRIRRQAAKLSLHNARKEQTHFHDPYIVQPSIACQDSIGHILAKQPNNPNAACQRERATLPSRSPAQPLNQRLSLVQP